MEVDEEDETKMLTTTTGMNPLYMPDILPNVFHQFCPGDRLNLRLVCSDWDEVIRKLTRVNYLVKFLSAEAVEKFVNIFSPANSKYPPHEKFKLEGKDDDESDPIWRELVYYKFLATFGKYIKVLDLPSLEFIPGAKAALEEHCRELLSFYLHDDSAIPTQFPVISCSKLKELSIPGSYIVATSFLNEIVKCSNKLLEFVVDNEGANNNYNETLKPSEIMDFTRYLQLPYFQHLTTLDLWIPLSDQAWTLLSQCQFKLQKFLGEIPQPDEVVPDVRAESIRAFLDCQKETLMDLSIPNYVQHYTWDSVNNFGHPLPPTCFPLMPKLVSLSVGNYSDGSVQELISKTPSLTSLDLTHFTPSSPLDLSFEGGAGYVQTYPKITSLTLVFPPAFQLFECQFLNEWIQCAPLFAKLGCILPNLKEFELSSSYVQFLDSQAIIAYMPNLKSLDITVEESGYVYCFRLDDGCFTGLTRCLIEEGEQCLKFQDMKHLTSLSLTEACEWTDAEDAITGLANCANLEKLIIKDSKLTRRNLVFLADKLRSHKNLKHIDLKIKCEEEAEGVSLVDVEFFFKEAMPNALIRISEFEEEDIVPPD